MTDRFVTRIVFLASGLCFAGISAAADFEAGAVDGASHWPWIAAAAIFGLLGVVSFASRRRIHAVVGS